MAGWWAELPVGRVVWLVGADPDAIALSAADPPGDGPAIVTYRMSAAASPAEVVGAALDELERVALELYPAWLPGAAGIRSAGGAGGAAVRALAMRLAAATGQFGPFLADLAEGALRGAAPHSGRFGPEVRAAGLAQVIATSFSRPQAALLIWWPDDLPPGGDRPLVAGCRWLADWSGLGVWLIGRRPGEAADVEVVEVELPDSVAGLASEVSPAWIGPPEPAASYPAVAGRPHPASKAEHALESALATRAWASGRVWNQPYAPDPLVSPIRIDLLWAAERCAVEIDGPEHCHPLRFAADRRRDVALQLDGYAVLRFTNAQVLDDVQAVVAKVERLIRSRRLDAARRDAPRRQPE